MRFSAVFMALVFAFSVAMPSFAAEATYISKDSFWNWIAGTNGVLQKVVAYSLGAGVCAKSEDTYHHADTYTKDLGDGRFNCICSYCGKDFVASASDLQQTYDAQVDTLPASGVDSDGYLYWYPAFKYGKYLPYRKNTERVLYWGNTDLVSTFTPIDMSVDVSWDENCSHFVQKPLESTFQINGSDFYFYFSDVVPIDGYYLVPFNVREVGFWLNSYGTRGDVTPEDVRYPSSPTYFAQGVSFSPEIHYWGDSTAALSYYDRRFYYYPVKIKPLSGLIDPVGDPTYNINTRPISITGDYGIIDDNGQLIKVEGDSIVNETNKTVYNPVTDTSNNVTEWNYDYSTRTYNITLDNGTTQTITYGDEHITIVEGDTVYNVYYITEGQQPTGCEHNWEEISSTPATCLEAGSRVVTCSLCNVTKTETIPAAGHIWVVKDHVLTEYDETGNVVVQGYTIYKCSVCGDEHRDDGGAGPPVAEDPTGFWDWWKDAWTSFTESLFGVLGSDPDSPSPGETSVPDTLLPGETPAPDDPDGEEGWTVFDLLAALKDSAWSIVKGTVSLAFDGIGGVVGAVTDIGNFFGGMGDVKSNMQQMGGDWNWTP